MTWGVWRSASGFGPQIGGVVNVPAATGWSSPLDASTPAYWWIDASNAGSITLSGSDVTDVADLGTGNHDMADGVTSPTLATAEVNGLNAITFINSASLATAGSWTLAQPFMLCMVWKQTTASTPALFGIIFDGDIAQVGSRAIVFNRRQDTSDHYTPYAGNIIDQGVSVVAGTVYHSRIIFNGASSSSVLNASDTGTVNMGTFGIINGIIMGTPSNNSFAQLCEAFIIENPTGDDATNAAAYTLAKWGV
jgi:hypothetical protein